MHHHERGSKIKIKISGKPEFGKAAVDHISLFSPRLEKLFKLT